MYRFHVEIPHNLLDWNRVDRSLPPFELFFIKIVK